MLRILVYVFLGGITLWALHHLCLWLERRGWLFYRDRKPSSSAVGGVFLEINSFFRSGARHDIEARKEVVREDEVGDPPKPNGTIDSD